MTDMPQVRVHAPDSIALDRVPLPETGEDDILIEVHRCGICGSDLSYIKLGGIPGAASPFALGHEFSGVIVEVGAGVSQWQVGDRVVVNPDRGCNAIGSGGIEGAFATHVLYQDAIRYPEGLLKLPDSLSFETGALVEPLAVGMHAARQGEIGPGDKVVIMGAGPVGLASAIAARHLGAADVQLVDLSARRLQVAARLGFATIEAAGEDLGERLQNVHGIVTNDPMLGDQPGTDVFIEATGAGPVLQQLTRVARKGARIVVVGVHFAPVTFDMTNFLMRELRLTASMAYPNEFPEVMDMLANNAVDTSALVSHRFGLSEFEQAFATAQQPGEAVKVIIDCQH